MTRFCLMDVGSTYTKGCWVDTDQVGILAWASAPTTASTDINEGIQNVLNQLKTIYPDFNYESMRLCSSAKGGLRMVAIGLVEDLTLKAARMACANAGAKLVGAYSHKLNLQELKEIETLKPDIILLSGGTDGGNEEVVLHNAKKLAKLNIKLPILYAGNKSCQDEIHQILSEVNHDVRISANVMPSYGVLNVESARDQIRACFLEQIIEAKGLSTLTSIVQDIIMPTPASVLDALSLLAYGTKQEKGLGDLMAVDVGGATTDVYSLTSSQAPSSGVQIKGLIEPLVKRSVEGDLGLRISAKHVLDLDLELQSNKDLSLYVDKVVQEIHGSSNSIYDEKLAAACVRIASRRHAGRLEQIYTSMGLETIQYGKDLRSVKTLIGIGGPIVYAVEPSHILNQVKQTEADILLPQTIEFILDKQYILSCLGLLAKTHPDWALKTMKHHLEKIHG